MNFEAVFFDLDGTLVNSVEDLNVAINATREQYALPPFTLAQTKSAIGDGELMLIKRVFSDAPEITDILTPLKFYKEYYQNHILDKTTLFPGVLETMRELSKTRKLGLVTNKGQGAAEYICKTLGIADYFTCMIGFGQTKNCKPFPDQILLGMERTGCTADKVLMVGDHLTDIGAAVAAHCSSCFCNYGFGRIDKEQPTYRIDTFSQLLDIV